jgi:hypothetical protein
VGKVYVIIVVPMAIPLTTPLTAPMVPIVVKLLLQVPPAGLLLSVADAPAHTALAPLIVVGSGLMAITALPIVVVQPAAVVASTV